MRADLRTVFESYQLLAFVTLTLGISWGWWALAWFTIGNGELSMGLIIPGGFGPPIAAALVTWGSGGSLRDWISQLIRFRVSPRGYIIAFVVPAIAFLGGISSVLLITGHPLAPSVLPGRLPMFVMGTLVAFFVGGGQEELGWRGFMLPRLQTTYSALVASLLIGVVWAVWHLPLFLMDAARNASGNFLLYAVLVLGVSILMTWCYNSTGGSVLLTMLLHAGFNSVGGLIPATMETVEQLTVTLDVGMIAGVWVVTIAVVAWRNISSLSRYGIPDPTIAGVPSKEETAS